MLAFHAPPKDEESDPSAFGPGSGPNPWYGQEFRMEHCGKFRMQDSRVDPKDYAELGRY